MALDKCWMQVLNRLCREYIDGVLFFMGFASRCVNKMNRMRCPCCSCNNALFRPVDEVKQHLLKKGIKQSYTSWVYHGEVIERTHKDPTATDLGEDDDRENDVEDNDDVQEIIGDIHAGAFVDEFLAESSTSHRRLTQSDGDAEWFAKLVEDTQRELYPGFDKYSRASFLLKLLHIKNLNCMTQKGFDMIIELFRDVLLFGESLPKSFYEAKSIMRELDLSYVMIDACVNDCVLFWKEHVDKEECPVCQEKRWEETSSRKKKSPRKVLSYFPIIPRLKRLFLSKHTAKDMRWHKYKRVAEANVLRHPVDSECWQHFDNQHEWFARDARNVRLGLASDGFNPFGNMSNAYSMWPVILVPYNLPPWKCMKEQFFMMSLLIPEPKAPGNDIDVYLRPLIDDLNDLWENGVEAYDASTKETFRMRAVVLWTINDFPAYANLSGWSTKGKLACPTFNEGTCSYSFNGHKTVHLGTRRHLPRGHHWRRKGHLFNGKSEHGQPPKELSSDDVLQQLSWIGDVTFSKKKEIRLKRKREEDLLGKENVVNWKKRSIFFELPYWRTLKLRHNLDVMHIEKNICESVFGTNENPWQNKRYGKSSQ